MEIGALFFLIFFLFCILVLVFLYFFYFFYSFFTRRAPYVSTFNSCLNLLGAFSKSSLSFIGHGARVIDLGCGDGKVLRFFAKTFRCSTCVGYDINLFAILLGKFLNFLHNHKNIFLYHGAFEQANLADFDYIYVYLFSNQVASIEDWVFTTKKPEAIVICNTFAFGRHQPFWVLYDGKQKIYFYR